MDGLSDYQISVLLYHLYRDAGCHGMRKLVEHIIKSGVVPVEKKMDYSMKKPRTTRWIVQYILVATLAHIEFSADRTKRWMLSWKFIDEAKSPRKDSLKNAIANVYKYKKYTLIPLGKCPVCKIIQIQHGCPYTPLHLVQKMPREELKSLIEKVYRTRPLDEVLSRHKQEGNA